jgi:integrase
VPISSLTTRKLELFLIHIAQTKGNTCSNNHLKEIKAMFNWTMRREETGVAKNPCNYIKRLPQKEFVKYVPPIEHINLVLMAANPEQMNLIKAVFHGFGRIGELLRLKWSDVDFEGNLIILWTKKRSDGSMEPQYKPMSQTLREVLGHQWKHRKHEQYVFPNPRTGRPYSESPRWMEDVCTRAGVPAFGFHALRHAVAHLVFNEGEPLGIVSELLGHKRKTTTEIYLKGVMKSHGSVIKILDHVHEQEGEQKVNEKESTARSPAPVSGEQ